MKGMFLSDLILVTVTTKRTLGTHHLISGGGGGGLEFLLLANFFFTSGGKQAFFGRSTSDNFFFMFRRRNFLSCAFPINVDYGTLPFGVFSGQLIFHQFRQPTFFSAHIFNKLFFWRQTIFFNFTLGPPPPDIKWCVPYNIFVSEIQIYV